MDILYGDESIVVCLKEPGVLSTDEEGGVPSLLRRQLGTEDIRTVHRLDRVVGGLMVLARSETAAAELSRQIMERRFGKAYLAVVRGCLPAAGTLTDLLYRDRRERKTYVTKERGKGVQEAILDYRMLAAAEGLCLLRIELRTGRTHQIRAQFSARGWPLVGDRKYGLPEDGCPIALWSAELRFSHPATGEKMDFSAPPPEKWPWTLFPRA